MTRPYRRTPFGAAYLQAREEKRLKASRIATGSENIRDYWASQREIAA